VGRGDWQGMASELNHVFIWSFGLVLAIQNSDTCAKFRHSDIDSLLLSSARAVVATKSRVTFFFYPLKRECR
jgi:hypothetical protein